MNRPPAGLGFGVNVAITVLVTLAIGTGAYSVMVRSVHPTAAVQPTAPATPSSAASPASPSPLQPLPTPRQSPPRLAPIALSLVGPSTGWSLLTSCTAPTNLVCHYSVTATLDGGRTWGRPVRVGPTSVSVDGGGPRHVRFLNRLDGFVFGFGGAYVTHDGGKSWNDAGLPAVFTYDIAIGGKTAWAVTSPCAKGVMCQVEVRASLDGGRTWRAPHSLPSGFSPEALVAFESGVVMTRVPTGEMELTTDGGATWRAINTQCTGNPFRGYVATFDGKELWELCMGYPDTASNSADKALFVSEDAGRSWAARATSQPGSWLQQAGWPVWLVSNREGVAFMSGSPTALVTHDAGSTWAEVSDQLSEIHFEGPSTGSAVDGAGNIWVTADGGEHWSQAGGLPTEFSQ